MKIKLIIPVISNLFTSKPQIEVNQIKAPDTEIQVVNLERGPASIESHYDDMLAAYDIVEKTVQAEKDGFNGVFISCFADPGVEAAREMVNIPVVGGFQPAALTASLISGKWSVITVLSTVFSTINGLARKLGIDKNLASIRSVDIPVLDLDNEQLMRTRLLEQAEKAVREDMAEAVVLGCTGMLGVSQELSKDLADKGIPIPVIDPTPAAIGYLEMLHRSRISHSKLSYAKPPKKERRF
jgi:allantoin racemase